jgi:hypothetical protein
MQVNFLQMTDAKSWSGMTTKNHLGAIFESRPQLASKMITRMLSQYYGTSLDAQLSQIPSLTLDTDDDYTWKLIGSAERNIPLVEARYQGSTVTSTDYGIGANGTEFLLVFAERLFSDVNVIVGEKNEIYPIRVLDDPSPEGTNWLYRVEMWGNSKVDGMPGEELVAGKRFSKDYSPVEDTLSIKGGEVSYTSPISFRNTFSRIRMQYTAPGNMKDAKFAAEFTQLGPNGEKKTFVTWMEYQNWVFEHQFAQEKNRLLWYGRSARDSKGKFSSVGKSGHIISAGAGLREQMEISNTFFYSKFTADYITNILTELSEGKLSIDERKFVIRTGERGAILFHKAIAAEASGWTPLFDQAAQTKVSSPLHENARKFGFQYTEFLAPNGIHVKVEIDPIYSDPVRNKMMAPNNGHFFGGVAESYRMDILDMGTVEGEANIRKVYASNVPDTTGYIPGLRHPFSPTGERGMNLMATPKDGYEVHKFATCSGFIKDVSRTASLIPSIMASI